MQEMNTKINSIKHLCAHTNCQLHFLPSTLQLHVHGLQLNTYPTSSYLLKNGLCSHLCHILRSEENKSQNHTQFMNLYEEY